MQFGQQSLILTENALYAEGFNTLKAKRREIVSDVKNADMNLFFDDLALHFSWNRKIINLLKMI